MKKLIASLLGFMLVIGLSAQTAADDKALSKAEKKEIKAKEKAAQKELILQAIKDRKFVIESYILEDRYGRFIHVSPVTNFVAVDSTEAVIQFALPNRIGGYNGLGGITEEGRLKSIKFPEKKSKYGISFEMDVVGPAFGSTRIYVDINDDGFAYMRISGAFGARFSMRGNFELLDDSVVFKGVARY